MTLEHLIKTAWDACKDNREIIRFDPEKELKRRVLEPAGEGGGRSGLSFHILYNPDRDKRQGTSPDGCPLCKNILEKGSGIYKTPNYIVAPNSWPINPYHTVILLDKPCPEADRQGQLMATDLMDMVDYAAVSGQFVIYNTFGAAATVDHQHFQGFYYDAPFHKLEISPLSEHGVMWEMGEYPGANFVFLGKHGIPEAIKWIDKIRRHGYAYSVGIHAERERITVVPRVIAAEIPDCTKKKIGGFEDLGGVFVVGDIKEKDKQGNERTIETGQRVFNRLGYMDLLWALKRTTVPREKFKGWYKPHPSYKPRYTHE